jgi:hypothetical protein
MPGMRWRNVSGSAVNKAGSSSTIRILSFTRRSSYSAIEILGETQFHRLPEQLRNVVRIEPVHQVQAMNLHRATAETQMSRDLPIGHALQHKV